MRWQRTSTVDSLPPDPLGEAVAHALTDVLAGATVALVYAPMGADLPEVASEPGTAAATGAGPPGWQVTLIVRLRDRLARLMDTGDPSSLAELVAALPGAGIRAAAPFRHHDGGESIAVSPALNRALRDMVAAEVLREYIGSRVGRAVRPDLVAETIEFLVELSGTRVESHDLTHGVIVADALRDTPRLELAYPADIRAAKRAPLLFDGQRSVLLVDPEGRARTELQRHRFERLMPNAGPGPVSNDDRLDSGSLVADATRALGGSGSSSGPTAASGPSSTVSRCSSAGASTGPPSPWSSPRRSPT